jgi:hypothetical protein
MDQQRPQEGRAAQLGNMCSSLCVHISSEAHPASYAMGTVGPFPGVKRGRGVTLITHAQ